VAAHNFIGSSHGSATAQGVLVAAHNFIGTSGGLAATSGTLNGAPVKSLVFGKAGTWRLDIYGHGKDGTQFLLNRKVSSVYTPITGGSCSIEDLHSLWPELAKAIG
jgi:hypothetical protein